MERVAQLAAFFKLPTMVCINKFDLNPDQGRSIEDFAAKKNIAVVGRIPFDPVFTRAMVQGKTIFEFDRWSDGSQAVEKIWDNVARYMDLQRQA
jgi:MinD superfamily P-loop ATPase